MASSYALSRPKWHQKRILAHSAVYPTLSAHIACQKVQCTWRGHNERKRRNKKLNNPPPSLSAFDQRFLNFVARHRLEPSAGSLLLLACLRLQAWWRMQRLRRHAKKVLFRSFSLAAHSIAKSIQQWFRAGRLLRRLHRKPRSKPYAAWLIQRAWTRHLDRRTYRYFRDLLVFRNSGDPITMLKSIVPRETELLDPAVGARVRFRLSGEHPVWPPAILFRVYISAPLCDVNAFAPREYHHNLTPADSLSGEFPSSPHRDVQLPALRATSGICNLGVLSTRSRDVHVAPPTPTRVIPSVKLRTMPEPRKGSREGSSGGFVTAASASTQESSVITASGHPPRGTKTTLMGIRVGKTVFGARLATSADRVAEPAEHPLFSQHGRLQFPPITRPSLHSDRIVSRDSKVNGGLTNLVLFSTAPELLELSTLPALVSHAGAFGAVQAGCAKRGLVKSTMSGGTSTVSALQQSWRRGTPQTVNDTLNRCALPATVTTIGRASYLSPKQTQRVLLESADDVTPGHWYKRDSLVLNDWRPVSLSAVEAADGIDPVLKQRRTLALIYRSPRVTGPTLAQARSAAKHRRRKWLTTLYAKGRLKAAVLPLENTAAAVGASSAGPLHLLQRKDPDVPLTLHSLGLLIEAALVAGAVDAGATVEGRRLGVPPQQQETAASKTELSSLPSFGDASGDEGSSTELSLEDSPALGATSSLLAALTLRSPLMTPTLMPIAASSTAEIAPKVHEQLETDKSIERAYELANRSAAELIQAAAAARSKSPARIPCPPDESQNGDFFDSYVASWRALGTSLRPAPTVLAAARRR